MLLRVRLQNSPICFKTRYNDVMFLRLEALPVDDGRSGFVVLLLADPHLLKGGERSQDGATDPDGVLPLWRSDDFNLHRGWSQRGDLLLHAVSDAWIHCGASV